jgi:hypothetical protein
LELIIVFAFAIPRHVVMGRNNRADKVRVDHGGKERETRRCALGLAARA